MNKIIFKKNFTNLFPQIKSVINIEREDFYPFLHPIVKNYLPSFKQKSSSYAQVFPKDINKFLENQENEFKDSKNTEVIKNKNKNIIPKGRSNVGKSSLINTLLHNQEAKVSKTPGKTNYLQFLYLPAAGLSFVDCPGYGYANRSKKERSEWNKMMETYLVHNKFLKRLFVLIDAEVGIGELDENCIKMSSFSQLEFNVVLTKTDKLKNKADLLERVERCKSIISKYSHFSPFIFLTSTKDYVGIDELKCYLLFLNIMQDYQSQDFKI